MYMNKDMNKDMNTDTESQSQSEPEPEPESPTNLLSLPQELLEEIILHLDPIDVSMISKSCSKMWGIVYGFPWGLKFIGVNVILDDDDDDDEKDEEENDNEEEGKEGEVKVVNDKREKGDDDNKGQGIGEGSVEGSSSTQRKVVVKVKVTKEEKEEEKKKRKLSRKVLWRLLYLAQLLDDPRECVNWIGIPRIPKSKGDVEDIEGVDWQEELKKIVRARTIVSMPRLCKSEEELKEVLRIFLGLVEWVPPLSEKDCVVDLSRNLLWVPAVLKEFLDGIMLGVRVSTPTPDATATPPMTENSDATTSQHEHENKPRIQYKVPPFEHWQEETKLLHAHLHTLYGLTKNDILPSTQSHIQSLAYVYDMRKYNAENDYGPLLKDGKVNWVHIQKIHHVASLHVVGDSLPPSLLSGSNSGGGHDGFEYEYIIYPMSMPFTQILIPGERGVKRSIALVENENVDEMRDRDGYGIGVGIGINGGWLPENADWAGVGGHWKIMFCFCDHRDLIDFNKSAESDDGPLDISLFGERPGLTEVFRTIDANLHVTRIANDPNHPGRPIIGFVGEIGQPSSTSTMYGCIQLTPDNHVKWQFYSGEGGQSIWSSVGIQVGGIGSSFGVLGSWTTVFHDAEDPVGPLWMQKA